MGAPHCCRDRDGDKLDRLHGQRRAAKDSIVMDDLGDEDLGAVIHEGEDIGDFIVGALHSVFGIMQEVAWSLAIRV